MAENHGKASGPRVEHLMTEARKSGRYGHRDATMILIGFRHALIEHAR
jgi:hypothetical protein